jgi:hypothetical protein
LFAISGVRMLFFAVYFITSSILGLI